MEISKEMTVKSTLAIHGLLSPCALTQKNSEKKQKHTLLFQNSKMINQGIRFVIARRTITLIYVLGMLYTVSKVLETD